MVAHQVAAFVTEHGRAVSEEADALVAKLDERLTAGLSEADLVLAREVLARIAENAARAMARAGSS